MSDNTSNNENNTSNNEEEEWTPPEHLYDAMSYPKEKAERGKHFAAYSTLELSDTAKSNLSTVLDMLSDRYYKYRYFCTDWEGNNDTINSGIRNYYKGDVVVFTVKDTDCKRATDNNVVAVNGGFVEGEDVYKYLRYWNKNNYEKWKSGRRGIEAIKLRTLLGADLYSLPKFILIYTEDGVEDSSVWSKSKNWDKAGYISNVVYIANRLDIPVINLYKDDSIERVRELLN